MEIIKGLIIEHFKELGFNIRTKLVFKNKVKNKPDLVLYIIQLQKKKEFFLILVSNYRDFSIAKFFEDKINALSNYKRNIENIIKNHGFGISFSKTLPSYAEEESGFILTTLIVPKVENETIEILILKPDLFSSVQSINGRSYGKNVKIYETKVLRSIQDLTPHLKLSSEFKKTISIIIENTIQEFENLDCFLILTPLIVQCAIFIAIRIHKFPIFQNELIRGSLSYNLIMKKISFLIINVILPKLNLEMKPLTVELLLKRFIYDLKLPMEMESQMLSIFEDAKNKGLRIRGRMPEAIAAAIVYLSAKGNNIEISYEKIEKAANLSAPTLRTTIRELKKLQSN